jgi:zinc/manganese transport system ATP-binding protein
VSVGHWCIPNVIQLTALTCRFGEILALKNIDLRIASGSLVAIVGANGSGKSTLLKLIAGLYTPSEGSLTAPRASMAFLPQRSEIDRTFPLRVLDVAAMGLWSELGLTQRLTHHYRQRLLAALSDVGLADLAERSVLALSGGQLQRLLFARLILQDADLILLDEPFAGLDYRTIEELMDLITRWHKQGRTILAVMHDLEMVKTHFPETILLAQELIAFGPTPKVLTAKNFVGALFHE